MFIGSSRKVQLRGRGEKGDIPKCYWKETAREKRKEKGEGERGHI
jgi:hypothetical protein